MDTNGPQQGRVVGITLANVGQAKHMAQGEFRISQSYLSVNQTLFGFFAYLSTVTIDNTLCLSLGTLSPVVSAASGQAILDDIVAILQTAKTTVLRDAGTAESTGASVQPTVSQS